VKALVALELVQVEPALGLLRTQAALSAGSR
jgi:hypothetical protein